MHEYCRNKRILILLRCCCWKQDVPDLIQNSKAVLHDNCVFNQKLHKYQVSLRTVPQMKNEATRIRVVYRVVKVSSNSNQEL